MKILISGLFGILGLLVLISIFFTSKLLAQTEISGDIDGNGKIDIFDFNVLYSDLGKSDQKKSDFDGNGIVEPNDIKIFITEFFFKKPSRTTELSASPESSDNIQAIQNPVDQGSPPAKIESAASVEGIPVCSDHDPYKWHPLVKRDSNGNITCTYTHEHKDDPNGLNDKFGPPQFEISHPWETHKENTLKHRVYAWYVVKDLPCINLNTRNGDLGMTDIRLQMHADGVAGALTRIHSFAVELQTCSETDPNYKGYLKTGGHADFGPLRLMNMPNDPIGWVPLPADNNEYCGNITSKNISQFSNRRMHMGKGTKQIGTFTWYGGNTRCKIPGGGSQVIAWNNIGILQEDWGPVDPTSPNNPVLFHNWQPKSGPLNGSWAEKIHILGFRVPDYADSLDGKKDGFLNYAGWTNRFGQIVKGCSAPSLDCVPFEARNLKVGFYEFRQHYHNLRGKEYDVKSPVTGKSLILYPN